MEDTGAMLATKQQGVTTIVRQATGDQLLISACGRTCSIDMQHSRSIVDLQAALQRTLQMEGQAFHICDINGALLSTDMQVQDAIAQGLTPLCATLPDKSLHHLENRREELAQMQWKLVRDQMTQSNNQVTQLTRQLNELQFQVSAIQRESQHAIENWRLDTCKAMEVERLTTKAELQPVQEAVNGAVLLINGERSKRELSVQGFEKHIHGVCDMLDGERASRRQDLAMHMSVMQELRTSLDSERSQRTELNETVMDLKRAFQKFQEEMTLTQREQDDKLSKVESEASMSLSDITSRFAELEDRSAALENSLTETTSWTTGSLDKIGERHERVSQAVETMRLSTKHHEGSIANCIERVRDLETLVRQYDMETRDGLTKEKQVREDQVRRTSQVFTNESLKQITELEKRLTIRLERESAEREKNFQSMIDEVTKIVDDRRLFRDQTITKTVSDRNQGGVSTTRIGGEFDGLGPTGSYQPSDATAPDLTGAHEKVQPLMGSERVIASGPIMASGPIVTEVVGYGNAPTYGNVPTYGNAPTLSYTGPFMAAGNSNSRSGTPLKARVLNTTSPMGTIPVPVPYTGPATSTSLTMALGGSSTLPVAVAGGSQSGSLQGSLQGSLRAPMSARVSTGTVGPSLSYPRIGQVSPVAAP